MKVTDLFDELICVTDENGIIKWLRNYDFWKIGDTFTIEEYNKVKQQHYELFHNLGK